MSSKVSYGDLLTGPEFKKNAAIIGRAFNKPVSGVTPVSIKISKTKKGFEAVLSAGLANRKTYETEDLDELLEKIRGSLEKYFKAKTEKPVSKLEN